MLFSFCLTLFLFSSQRLSAFDDYDDDDDASDDDASDDDASDDDDDDDDDDDCYVHFKLCSC